MRTDHDMHRVLSSEPAQPGVHYGHKTALAVMRIKGAQVISAELGTCRTGGTPHDARL